MPSSPPFTGEQLLAVFLRLDHAVGEAESANAIETAAAITQLAVQHIPGVEQASISEDRNGTLRTLASTGAMATAADLLQFELRSGPCVAALTDDGAYRTADIAADDRWPELGRRAITESVAASMLSFRLYAAEVTRIIGLNLYSAQPAAFDDDAHALGAILATYSAHALRTATAREKAANLQQALNTNREIGAAMGIIMATHKVTRDSAFTLLRVASQNSNRKLIDIAADVVDTGLLPQPTPGAVFDTLRKSSARNPDRAAGADT